MRLAIPFRLLALCTVVFLAGCSSSNKGKIEGTSWSSDAGTVKGQSIPAGMLKLDFASDGKLTYTVGPQALTGTYSLGMGNTVTFNLNQELAGRKSHAQKITINGAKMTVADSDGTSLTFSKVK